MTETAPLPDADTDLDGAPRSTIPLGQLFGLLARLILGGVLIAAAIPKILEGAKVSARAVQAYQIMPFDVAKWVGIALPWIEVVVGVLLVLGLLTRYAAVVGSLLMVAFLIGIGWVWSQGLSIDCGCFGGGGQVEASATRYPQDMVRDAGLLFCGLWLVARPRTLLSLDRVLFGA